MSGCGVRKTNIQMWDKEHHAVDKCVIKTSVITNITECAHQVTEHLEMGKGIPVIFQSAFILLNKYQCGIRNTINHKRAYIIYPEKNME